MLIRWQLVALSCWLVGWWAVPSFAQPYPSRPIELVSATGAGGGSDLVCRQVAEIIARQKLLPQPVFVVNKPGGGGAVGQTYVSARRGDPYIFLQAATNDRSPAFACFELVESRQVRLVVSPVILAEVQDVLTRPKLQKKFRSLTRERVDLFLEKVASLATLVPHVPSSEFTLRDPDDLPYFDLAVSERAEYLVSRDNDLLDLMTEAEFIARFSQLRIVDPVAFLGIARHSI